MSRNLGYTKKFIILKKDFSNMAGLNPKGHGKIEIKGIKGSISLSLENAEATEFYNVLLINRDKSYDVGKIYTDDNGKGREELIFNISDLESKGFSVDRLNSIIIIRDTKVLLGGYIDKEDGSIDRFIKQLETSVAPIKEKEIKEGLVSVEIVQEEVVQEEVVQEEVVQEEIIEEEVVQEEIVKEEVVQDEVAQEEIIEEEVVEEEIVQQEIIKEDLIHGEFYDDTILAEQDKEEIIAEEPIIHESVYEECISAEEVISEEINLNDPISESLIVGEIISEIEDPTKEVIAEEMTIPANNGDPIYLEENFEPIFEPIVELMQEPEPVAEEISDIELKCENQPVFIESDEMTDKNDFDYEYNRKLIQKNQTTSYVLNILRYFPYIDPFRINLEGYNWWKVDFEDDGKGFLPYFSYVVGGDQKIKRTDNKITAKELMNMYGHYLFGLYNEGDEVKYYVYAVPGGFYKDEHPYGGITGFNTWFAGNAIPGYWLMYIDPLTGKVIFPINQMNPIE